MIWLILAAALAAYIYTVRLAAHAQYQSNRRSAYSDDGISYGYDGSNYERRDAPHHDDWMLGAIVALFFPISLPILLGMKWWGVFDGSAEKRWEEKQKNLWEQRVEIDRLQKIVDELGGVPGD